MDILYALEGLRTPFLNAVFSVLTYLGDQTVCIAAVLLLLWCFDKQKGYCLFLIATTGTAVNQLLKAFFLIPRPWVKDPAFTIVESARAAATGYSFPSGHTQNVTAEFSAIALWAKRRWVTWLCAIIILLTGFSRMYLGVHTPLDVGVSLVVGLLTSLVCIRLFDRLRPGAIRGIILAAMALMLGYLLLAPKGSANVAEFDQHGLESAYSLAGAALWLFCPVVIFMSSVQIQFDVLSALFMLLVVILLRKDRCFLAGMVLTTAILLKFFPAFTLFVLIGYVYVKHRGSGTVIRRLVSAAVGMVLMVVVLYLPTILDGNFMDSLFFMTGRLETQTSSGAFYEIGSFLLMAVGLIGMFVAGYRMFRARPEDADKGLISNVLLSLTFAMFISIMPQYVLILMPFLIIVMLTSDGRMRLAWIVVSAGAMLTVLVSNNIMLLDTLAACTGIVSPGWVAEMAVAIETVRIGGYTLVTILGALGGVIECLGLVFILLLYLEDAAGNRIPRIAGALSKLKRWDFNEEQV